MNRLQGLQIVVTRPTHQAGRFQALLEQQGATTHLFPLLAIQAITPPASLLAQLQQPNSYDMVIFISANAVSLGLALSPRSPLWQTARLGAIGQATALALQQHGLSVSYVPQHGFRSEDFLALPDLQVLTQKRILIIRGRGGRELLAETLQARGAIVDYVDVYQRVCPAKSADKLKQLHSKQQLDIIAVTSNESLGNLLHLLSEPTDWIKAIPLLVGSERMRLEAKQAGFSFLLQAEDPGDQSMLAALLAWRGINNDDR